LHGRRSPHLAALPSRVRSETTPEHGFSLGETPVNSVVCQPVEGAVVSGPRVLARGYVITGGTRDIERVEVSLDRGETFVTARLDRGQAGPGGCGRRSSNSVPALASSLCAPGTRLLAPSRKAPKGSGT
jgi:hypothetical protein